MNPKVTSARSPPADPTTTEESESEEGSFSCTKCDGVFSWKRSLDRHMAAQHGDTTRLQCPVENCFVSISRSDHLRRHIRRTHRMDPDQILTPSKPKGSLKSRAFQCTLDECDAGFTTMDHLRRHVRRVHKADPDDFFPLRKSKRERKQVSLVDGSSDEDDDNDGQGGDVNCILCGSKFSPDANQNGNRDRVQFEKFASEILEDDPNVGFVSEALVSTEQLPVCTDCLGMSRSALERKLEADRIEKKVKELERQVELEKLKLREALGQFCEEMKKIEEMVSDADVAGLERSLKIDVGTRTRKKVGKSPVLILRDGIISVANELKMFEPGPSKREPAPTPSIARKMTPGYPKKRHSKSGDSSSSDDTSDIEDNGNGEVEEPEDSDDAAEGHSDSESEKGCPFESEWKPGSGRFKRVRCSANHKSHNKQLEIRLQQRNDKDKDNKLSGKPFNCDACGKVFVTKDVLERHMATHKKDQRASSVRNGSAGFTFKITKRH